MHARCVASTGHASLSPAAVAAAAVQKDHRVQLLALEHGISLCTPRRYCMNRATAAQKSSPHQLSSLVSAAAAELLLVGAPRTDCCYQDQQQRQQPVELCPAAVPAALPDQSLLLALHR